MNLPIKFASVGSDETCSCKCQTGVYVFSGGRSEI